MEITLSLRDAHGERVGADRPLAEGTLTIGRAPGNDWVLADPERHLSKTHCRIDVRDGRAVLTDVSSNGVFINGETDRVARNGQVTLRHGDEIGLGDYVIVVTATAGGARRGGTSDHGAGTLTSGGGAADPFGRLGGASNDPLAADPFATPVQGSDRDGFPPLRPPASVARPAMARDAFDVVDEAAATPGLREPGDLFRGIQPAESWQGPSQPDNADGPHQAFAPPRVRPSSRLDDLDLDALLGDTPPGPPPDAKPPDAKPPDAKPPGATAPPLPIAPRPQATPEPVATEAAGTARPAASTTDASVLLAAFLDGAGVAGLDCGPDAEATLRSAGQVFAILVAGLCQTLRARTAVKNEFRVDQTMIKPLDNNPLKFSLNERDAVATMLQAPRAGYLDAASSAREAFRDIGEHQMAVMVGVQAALLALLKRFEPAALEKRLDFGPARRSSAGRAQGPYLGTVLRHLWRDRP